MQFSPRKLRTSRPLAAACVLLALAQGSLAAAAAGAGKALCIGADGHVEIEAAVDGQCTEFTANAAHEPANAAPALVADTAGAGHCGQCVDISLDSHCPAVEIRGPAAKNDVPPFTLAQPPVTANQALASTAAPLHAKRAPTPATRPIFLHVTAFLI